MITNAAGGCSSKNVGLEPAFLFSMLGSLARLFTSAWTVGVILVVGFGCAPTTKPRIHTVPRTATAEPLPNAQPQPSSRDSFNVAPPPALGGDHRTASPAIHYDVTVDDDVSSMTVRMCVDGGFPSRLFPGESHLSKYLSQARFEPSGPDVALEDGALVVGKANDTCLLYRIDLKRAAFAEHSTNSAVALGADVIATPDLFLWRARPFPTDDVTVRFIVDPKIHVSTPWEPVEDRFVVPSSTWKYYGRVVIGPGFTPLTVNVPGGVFDVAVLDGPFQPSAVVVAEFLKLTGAAVSTAWGEFPRRRTQVTLTPVPSQTVPFGLVIRGGGPAVHLLVGVSNDPRELAADWVTVHELSHLLTPTLRPIDSWFGEGIATYFQIVLRARGGLISEDEAWAELADGLRRGKRAEDGHSLAACAKVMRREHNYTHVYWGGTAFALLADVALRSKNLGSLESALASLKDCCTYANRSFAATELIDVMDAQLRSSEFRKLYDNVVTQPSFPDVANAFATLGIDREGNVVSGAEAVSDDGAKLRQAIMSAAVTP